MKKRITIKIFSFIIIILGILVFLYPVVSNFFIEQNQNEVIHKYNKQVERILEEGNIENELYKAQNYNNDLKNNNENTERYNEILNIDGSGIIGYIQIPKIDVNLPIYHGTSSDILMKRNRAS